MGLYQYLLGKVSTIASANGKTGEMTRINIY